MDHTTKRIAILGCGFLGQRVATRALQEGMEVTALTRNSAKAAELERLGVHRVVVAELDGREWHPLIEPRQDFVLNCVSSAGGGVEGYRKSYLEGMRSLVSWAEPGAIDTILFTSSTSVYAQDSGEWIDETDPAEGSSKGGAVLREAELMLENASSAARRRFILRLGGLYGPGRHWLLKRAMAEYAMEPGDEIFLNSTHVDDAASAIWAALKSPPHVSDGIFNIVDDQPTAKGEIVRYLHGELARRGLLAPGEETPVSARGRKGTRPNRQLSNARAREILQWRPAYSDYRAGYEPILSEVEKDRS